MKRGILFLNSPKLGGAERSSIHQSLMLKNIELHYVIPFLEDHEEASDLLKFMKNVGIKEDRISFIKISSSYYSLSRKKRKFNLISPVFGLIQTLLQIDKTKFKNVDFWWLNGNKIAFLMLLFANIIRFKGKVIWHFRDYPSNSGIFKFFISLNNLLSRYKLKLIGNSKSVETSLKKIYHLSKVDYIYNPVGELLTSRDIDNPVRTIGVVAMFSPWKGIHQIIIMASLYEKELLERGVEKIKIFGGDLYQTDGPHITYQNELLALKEKFPSTLISFEGRVAPEKIFSSIDLLIHCSIEREPFGRVILEAFQSKVPVLSTSLGGAYELAGDDNRALSFFPEDYNHLFTQIVNIIEHDSQTKSRIENALAFCQELNKQIHEKIENIFNT